MRDSGRNSGKRRNALNGNETLVDFLTSALIEGEPYFRAFVVGHSLSLEPRRDIGSRARVEIAAYGLLIRQANRRLFRLKERLTSRSEEVTGSDLLNRILAEPQQLSLTNRLQWFMRGCGEERIPRVKYCWAASANLSGAFLSLMGTLPRHSGKN